MNIRQKKKRCKRFIAKAGSKFFINHKIRTKHIRLMPRGFDKAATWFLYEHDGYTIEVKVSKDEEKEKEIREKSPDLPDEAAGHELQETG